MPFYALPCSFKTGHTKGFTPLIESIIIAEIVHAFDVWLIFFICLKWFIVEVEEVLTFSVFWNEVYQTESLAVLVTLMGVEEAKDTLVPSVSIISAPFEDIVLGSNCWIRQDSIATLQVVDDELFSRCSVCEVSEG
jgi:hypothetical protein